ncbi:CPBP family intramembrane glutamic endopeptidase [Deinococcus cellulosilyticus]|uniref:CAAX amino protease n=1 Tax=Deinococcus cellulosilyticus (strain DSM 18568 / NBRC 106333 / KACC 11606 / 5516J-15) TaxID=1223518 RepID=A0A511MZY5_DEIC1|nr:CPBP family intramembrane glutamic endopeptidase [Deinococcus cellulosilyticus]GEM46119.1 CAAX amino protease [Deinococcus cellulosilyticus NBRC 106333 = KACC 11606]
MLRTFQNQSLLVFLLLTFAFSWCFWIPAALLFRGELQGQAVWSMPRMILLQTLGAVGPSLMAFVVVWSRSGPAGVRAFVHRGFQGRPGWWLAGCLLVPALALLAVMLHPLLDPAYVMPDDAPLKPMLRDIGWTGVLLTFPMVLLSQVFSSPLMEEFGWRGFALPHLQVRFGALVANLILGVLWGVWHLPLVIAYGDAFGPYMLLILANALLMGFLFNSSGGHMLVALLVHASMNVGLNIFSVERNDPVLIVLSWVCVLVVLWRFGARDFAVRPRVQWSWPEKEKP